jgi:hypothetical protein
LRYHVSVFTLGSLLSPHLGQTRPHGLLYAASAAKLGGDVQIAASNSTIPDRFTDILFVPINCNARGSSKRQEVNTDLQTHE